MNYEWRFSDDKPIYPQIVEQMERLIVSGELLPGDKLPSVRDLAREAQVNPNTMMRALSELENRELIISHRVNGKSVTVDTKLIKKVKDELAKNVIKDFLDGMMQLGYTKEEICEIKLNNGILQGDTMSPFYLF